jgi:hypothetical protein
MSDYGIKGYLWPTPNRIEPQRAFYAIFSKNSCATGKIYLKIADQEVTCCSLAIHNHS